MNTLKMFIDKSDSFFLKHNIMLNFDETTFDTNLCVSVRTELTIFDSLGLTVLDALKASVWTE